MGGRNSGRTVTDWARARRKFYLPMWHECHTCGKPFIRTTTLGWNWYKKFYCSKKCGNQAKHKNGFEWSKVTDKGWNPEKWSWLERKFETILKEMRLLDYQHNYKVEVEENRVFWIDFAFPTLHLGIEVDSKMYHGTAFAKSRDADRQELLEGVGWTIIRVRSEEVLRRPETVKKRVREAVGKAANNNLATLG